MFHAPAAADDIGVMFDGVCFRGTMHECVQQSSTMLDASSTDCPLSSSHSYGGGKERHGEIWGEGSTRWHLVPELNSQFNSCDSPFLRVLLLLYTIVYAWPRFSGVILTLPLNDYRSTNDSRREERGVLNDPQC